MRHYCNCRAESECSGHIPLKGLQPTETSRKLRGICNNGSILYVDNRQIVHGHTCEVETVRGTIDDGDYDRTIFERYLPARPTPRVIGLDDVGSTDVGERLHITEIIDSRERTAPVGQAIDVARSACFDVVSTIVANPEVGVGG